MNGAPATAHLLHESIRIELADASAAGAARRAAIALAKRMGLDETAQGKAALVVTEAATNITVHARRGELLLRGLANDDHRGVELLAIDSGPGMENPSRCLEDGYSTRGTAGAGLGSMRRNATAFDLYSRPGQGTIVHAEIWASSTRPVDGCDVGAICVPKRGEEVSGDAWALVSERGRASLVVLDGLGHGQLAADAAHRGLRTHRQHATLSPSELLRALHADLAGTRGAAVSAVEVARSERRVTFAGLGNVTGGIVDDDRVRRFTPLNGTVGTQLPRLQSFDHAVEPGALVVLHSDGLGSKWDLARYPGLLRKPAAIIAGALYRDAHRDRDDATVVVLRC